MHEEDMEEAIGLHERIESAISESDRDDLADFPASIRRSAKSKDDIIRMTKEILDTDEKELSAQRVIWEDLVAEIFGPVDESVFDLFL